MCTTNRQRRKKLILAYPDTRRLYRMMQVLAVFLAVATICIFAVGKWSENQIKEKNDQLFGRWNEVFLNVDEEDVEYFRRHAFVDDYSVQNIQEKIYLEGDDRIIIGTCNDNFFELGNLEMIDGRMPVNEGEVAIEEEYLDVLGVEKVGDIISEGVNIDSLKGYKVCGIVKDYSSRWKMVNWDVKYINCFISDAKANEIQIYASLSSAVQQDIETNMLEYRENVKIRLDSYGTSILLLWGMIGLLEIVLKLNLNRCIQGKFSISMSTKTYRAIKGVKRLRLSTKRALPILKLTSIILVLIMTNRIAEESSYFWKDTNSLDLLEEYVFYNYKYFMYILFPYTEDSIAIYKMIQDIDVRNYCIIISLFFGIILLSYLEYKIMVIHLQDNYCGHDQFLYEFYYGMKKGYGEMIIKLTIYEIAIDILVISGIVLFSVNSLTIAIQIVYSNILTAFLINFGFVIVKNIILYYTMKRVRSIDWLLTTEFE